MINKWHWNYPILSSLMLTTGLIVCILFFYFEPHFRFNLSTSLPHNLFFTLHIQPPYEKGQIVSFEHPQLNISVGKIIGGKPEDRISINNQTLFINDVEIGHVKSESNSGKTYHPIPEGFIPEGHYFVYTPHPDSFDSRYTEFGLVPEEWIKEVLWPLF